MNRLSIALFSFGLFVLSGCGVTQTVKNIIPGGSGSGVIPHEGEKVYFVIEERGMRRSRGYSVTNRSKFRGQPCIVTERVSTQEIERNNTKYTTTTRRKTIEAESGAALFASEVKVVGTERYQETVTIANGEAIFESVGPGGAKKSRIKVPRGIMFGIGASWLAKQNLAAGATFSHEVLNRTQQKISRETVKIVGRQTVNFMGEERVVWVASFEDEGYAPQEMVFTDNGEFISLKDDELAIRTVSADQFNEKQAPVTVVSSVPVDFSLPAWDTFSTQVFRAEPAESWRKYLKDSAYARIEDQGNAIMVVLMRTAPKVKSAKLPMQVPASLKPYLEENNNIMPKKFEIQQQARKIIRDERDVLRCVALLAGWVHHKIKFRSDSSLNPSPMETMETAAGDCSEHADLFASLARSIGIPTRHCHGLIIQKEEAIYHAWVEAWISGTWVPVDTTVNRVGLPACYLLTSYGTGDGEPRDEFAWSMRKGGIKLARVKSLVNRTSSSKEKSVYTLIPNEKNTYIAVDGQWFSSLYWGFSLLRPENWKGKVSPDLVVNLTSPDGQARVVIEGLAQEYRADGSNLELIVDSLRRNMPGFRQVDARILPFGKRKTSSLLCDFTTSETGRELRCRQYIIPKNGRSYRIALWAPVGGFKDFADDFKSIVDSVEF
ncbi:MAG: transglutaminase domain-containing protein [Planctomycetes bacterium]|nr:transglutaminase domain-containing protein [Planctomycetota bacterium]